MKDNIRELMDYVISKLDTLESVGFNRNWVKKKVSRWRKLTTTPEARWPNVQALYEELHRHSLPQYMALFEYQKPQSTSEQMRMKALLEYPEYYHDSWDQIHPPVDDEGRPMMTMREFWDSELKEKNSRGPYDVNDPYVQTEMDAIDSKAFKKKYEKYCKEWKAKWA